MSVIDQEADPLPTDGASDDSGSDDVAEPAMVLSRARRRNAGNRMSNLIALAEADDQERVIYGDASWEETVDDVEFGGVDAEVPDDVSLSSSEEDDDDNEDDDEAGERELKKQERIEKTKKRKELANPFANAARKKARLDPFTNMLREPRLKKKSERESWLPISDEGPTRASSRRQTMKNKEDTHARLLQKEKTREKVVRLMEAANKRKEELKPLSQAEKLAIAAKLEKENSRSLNRWEEAEERRVVEQQARLDALRNRQLTGPFIRYRSTQAVWKDDKLVAIGEKARRLQDADLLKSDEAPIKTSLVETNFHKNEQNSAVANMSVPNQTSSQVAMNVEEKPSTQSPTASDPRLISDGQMPSTLTEKTSAISSTATNDTQSFVQQKEGQSPQQSHYKPDMSTTPASSTFQDRPAAVSLPPAYPSTIMFPPPADGFLNGILDWASGHSLSEPAVAPTPHSQTEHVTSTAALSPSQIQPKPTTQLLDVSAPAGVPLDPSQTYSVGRSAMVQPSVNSLAHSYGLVPEIVLRDPPLPPPPKPVIRRTARTLLTLRSFDDLTSSQREMVCKVLLTPAAKPTRYLTKRADKSSLPPAVFCAITALPARYRDPGTGLPYRDKYAYSCIQRLVKGSCTWSRLLESYAGPAFGTTGNLGGRPAAGVPDRFWKKVRNPQITPKIEEGDVQDKGEQNVSQSVPPTSQSSVIKQNQDVKMSEDFPDKVAETLPDSTT